MAFRATVDSACGGTQPTLTIGVPILLMRLRMSCHLPGMRLTEARTRLCCRWAIVPAGCLKISLNSGPEHPDLGLVGQIGKDNFSIKFWKVTTELATILSGDDNALHVV